MLLLHGLVLKDRLRTSVNVVDCTKKVSYLAQHMRHKSLENDTAETPVTSGVAHPKISIGRFDRRSTRLVGDRERDEKEEDAFFLHLDSL